MRPLEKSASGSNKGAWLEFGVQGDGSAHTHKEGSILPRAGPPHTGLDGAFRLGGFGRSPGDYKLDASPPRRCAIYPRVPLVSGKRDPG